MDYNSRVVFTFFTAGVDPSSDIIVWSAGLVDVSIESVTSQVTKAEVNTAMVYGKDEKTSVLQLSSALQIVYLL